MNKEQLTRAIPRGVVAASAMGCVLYVGLAGRRIISLGRQHSFTPSSSEARLELDTLIWDCVVRLLDFVRFLSAMRYRLPYVIESLTMRYIPSIARLSIAGRGAFILAFYVLAEVLLFELPLNLGRAAFYWARDSEGANALSSRILHTALVPSLVKFSWLFLMEIPSAVAEVGGDRQMLHYGIWPMIVPIIMALVDRSWRRERFPPGCSNLKELENADLASRILTVANKGGFRAQRVSVADKPGGAPFLQDVHFVKIKAAETSGELPQVVVFRTLLESVSEEGLLQIIAHELGHHVYCHSFYVYIGFSLLISGSFAVFSAALHSRCFAQGMSLLPHSDKKFIPKYISSMYAALAMLQLLPLKDMGSAAFRAATEHTARKFAASLGFSGTAFRDVSYVHGNGKFNKVYGCDYSTLFSSPQQPSSGSAEKKNQ